METNLLKDVYEDILIFMEKEEQNVFFNERDLQMHLALYLQASSKKYDDVEVEYYVPVFDKKKNKILKDYDWNSEIRLDIVVIKNNEFLPVEIKYKTKKTSAPFIFKRFNKEIQCVNILKNQSAQDLGCYNFWKDVRRIEVIKKNYQENVKGGIALFLTNDSYYWNSNIKKNTAYYNFRLSEANKSLKKEWTNNVSTKVKHPDFKLDRVYSSEWIDKNSFLNLRNEKFRCFLVKVL